MTKPQTHKMIQGRNPDATEPNTRADRQVDACDNYKPIGTGECWNCGQAFHKHTEFQTRVDEAKLRTRLEEERDELLAACKLCARELQAMHSFHHPTCEGGCPFDEANKAARAAIAKAEGKQDFWYCSSDTTKEKDRMKGQATHTMKTQTEVETKVEASQMVSRIQDIDDDLCALITETSVGSETDKWLEAAHQHLYQAQQRITRAIELL